MTMEDAKPFVLPSFEDEARAVLEAAREKARGILEAALAERERILEEARREGLEAGRAEGRDAAAAGERERLRAETAPVGDTLRRWQEAVEEKRTELIAAAERDLLRLALAVAGKILKQEVRKKTSVAPASLKKAIEKVARRHTLQVLVHPADLAAVEQYLPELRRAFTEISEIKLEANEAVGKGGCVVSTKEGKVDAALQTQLQEVARGLLG